MKIPTGRPPGWPRLWVLSPISTTTQIPINAGLREVLSDYLGVPPERIVAGNGADELIDLLLRMFVGPGDNIILPTPTFGMYAFSTEVCGGETVSVERDGNFDIDIEGMKTAINSRTKATFFASPNNPTGNIASEAQIRELLETGILVVVERDILRVLRPHDAAPAG